MVKPVGESLKGKVGAEVAEQGDGDDDDCKSNTRIREIQAAIEPLKCLHKEIHRSDQRHDKQGAIEEVANDLTEQTFHIALTEKGSLPEAFLFNEFKFFTKRIP
jgi:hypothetical protein